MRPVAAPPMRALLLPAALAAGLFLPSSCTSPQPPPPNILILLMDTLRADRLGCYGYGRSTSPVIDSLAAGGTLFTRCYAPSDYTQASTASLFTGQYPLAHGYVNSNYVLEESNLTMAEIYAERGYRTAAFIANGLAGRKYRMDQGFHEHFESNRAPASELAEAAKEFIERQASADGSAPFLAYMHFLDVHDPHRIPLDWFDRFADPAAFAFDMQDTLLLETMVMRAWWSTAQSWWDDPAHEGDVARYFEDYSDLYDASIAYWDEAVASILEALADSGQDRNTVVVVTSDHGEQLLEHGFFGHANSGYDVGLHVPLVIFDPGASGGGRRISRPVSLLDVLPTLLARSGIPVPDHVQGRPLFSGAETGTGAEARPLYSEGTFFANRPVGTLVQTLREGRWKLILDRLRDSKELYDLSSDPGETRNLVETETEMAARLYRGVVELYNRNLEIFNSRRRSRSSLGAEKLRELRSLGYISHGGPWQRRPTEFFPLTGAGVMRFGPFGDEEDLPRFSDHLDLSRPGQAALGQIVRGCSEDPALADADGIWFDRRATFLMYNDGTRGRVRFDLTIDPRSPAAPTSLQVEFNDTPGEVYPVEGRGRLKVEGALPDSLRMPGYFHAGLLADSRFVLLAGPSPRTHRHASLKIRGVRLLE